MIEKKLQKNSILGNIPTEYNEGFAADGALVLATTKSMSFLNSTGGMFSAKQRVAQPQHSKNSRNFNFLEWMPGRTSLTPLTCDVITGPMSGCFVGILTYNGAPHAFHVGTSENPDRSQAAINGWRAWAGVNQAAVISGFAPAKQYNNRTPHYGAMKTAKEDKAYVFAVITTTGQYFAMLTYRQSTGGGLRVVDIKPIPALNLNNVINYVLPGNND